MTATVRGLVSLVPPPEHVRKQWNWGAIASDELGRKSQIKRDALRMAANSQELFGVPPTDTPYPIEALTVCAYTDNGDDIHWITDGGSDPSTWGIVVHATRDEEWDAFDGPLIEFLVAVFSGSYVCPIFPDHFPDSAGSRFLSQ